MKIAVTYENGQVFQHFGHTKCFKLYDVKDGEITAQTTIDTSAGGHCALADILKDNGVDTLICGGIGGGAKSALTEAGITFYAGVSGDADKAAEDLLADKLNYDSDTECEHHEHHHHGDDCGHHHGEHQGSVCDINGCCH